MFLLIRKYRDRGVGRLHVTSVLGEGEEMLKMKQRHTQQMFANVRK